MKYTDTKLVFREFPDEVTIAINISECPFRCEGCHTPSLRDDIGTELTADELERIIRKHLNIITCVGFMGGDANIQYLSKLVDDMKNRIGNSKKLKYGIYSGQDSLYNVLTRCNNFDYIKVGHFDSELGPIDKEGSNQRMYKLNYENGMYENITMRMRRKNF